MAPAATTATARHHQIRQALLDGASPVEARLAYGLHLHPDSIGSRTLERISGLDRSRVRAVVPAAGQVSDGGLLVCKDRGSSGLHEVTAMTVFLTRHDVPHDGATGHPESSSLDVPVVVDLQQVAAAPLGDEVLDPAMDQWSNSSQVDHRLGSHGWVLAMVFGQRTHVVRTRVLAGLLKLSPRGIRRALDVLIERSAGMVSRAGHGLVRIAFGALADSGYDEGRRVETKSREHFGEIRRFRQRRTPLGRMAWGMIRHRRSTIATAALMRDPRWSELAANGTQEQIYEHLVATFGADGQPEERVAVPAGPEPVDRPASVTPTPDILSVLLGMVRRSG